MYWIHDHGQFEILLALSVKKEKKSVKGDARECHTVCVCVCVCVFFLVNFRQLSGDLKINKLVFFELFDC
jgi:hypothetical protein